MKTQNNRPLLLSVLLAGLGLIPAGRLTAQTFTTLFTFGGASFSNPDAGGLILSGNTFYGTANNGCGGGCAHTVFAIDKDGTGSKNLYESFGEVRGLVLSSNVLYGANYSDGSSGYGNVFKLNTDGTGYTNLHSFADSDGHNPSGLMLSNNILYGTTSYGGSSGIGTVFKINTDGSGYTNLYSFTGAAYNGGLVTNSDGAFPDGGLVLSGDSLYGAAAGGSLGYGTVFKINTDGTGFTNLHTFNDDGDGRFPVNLIVSGKTLYGLTANSVYKLKADGSDFANLYSFTASDNHLRNSDGAYPNGLILLGETLYGTAYSGGTMGYGTMFAVNTDGTGFTNLHNFTGDSDGSRPIVQSTLGYALYGTAGGGAIGGTIFSLSFTPRVTVIPSGANVVLNWPTNYAGFDSTGYSLQSTTNLGSSVVWITNSPGPVLINGLNTVTNPISGTQKFYRLIR